jgi:hypothetical protein
MPAEYVTRNALGRYEDAAHRMSDQAREFLTRTGPDGIGKWLAFRLDTGECKAGPADHRYELVRHLARHGGDEKLYAYWCAAQDLSPRAAANFLKFNRQLHDSGMQIIDPDKDTEQVAPNRKGQFNLWRPADLLAGLGEIPILGERNVTR